jgi:hypothetical protein
MDADDLIRRNRELRSLAAAVCKEVEQHRAGYTAIRERTLDPVSRIRAMWEVAITSHMKRWRSHSLDSAFKRWSDGSSSAMDSQDAGG